MGRIGWKRKRKILQRDRWLCRYCGVNVHGRDQHRTDFATIDHVLPLARGGMSTQENMVTACRGCNEGKGEMTLVEYERAGKPRREYVKRRSNAGAALKFGRRTGV